MIKTINYGLRVVQAGVQQIQEADCLHFAILKNGHLHNGLTDWHEILHGDTYRFPNCISS